MSHLHPKRRVRRTNIARGASLRQKRSLARFIRILRTHLPEISARYQIKSLGVFGSFVRHAQKPHSDLDVLFDDGGFLGLFDQVHLQNDLSDLLGIKVDLVPRKGLKPHIGERILGEVVWVQLDGVPTDAALGNIARQNRSARMKQQREFLDFLKDIANAMDKVMRFVEGMTLDQFMVDERTRSAVEREVEIIGEATKHIPAEARKKYPAVPWKDMAGMRDRLAHGYFETDVSKLWETATRSIAEARPHVTAMLTMEIQRRSESDAQ